MKLAISGKGGVGKTTIAALLARRFTQDGLKVIAIDADPDANLAGALGIPRATTVTPLVQMHDLITERVGAEPGKPVVFFSMNPKVDDIPEKFAVLHNGIRLMAMGTIRRGGSGCACPENVIVRELIRHLLVERDEIVLLDTEAGIEHLSRGTAQFVNSLLVVVQATMSSLQTYHRIKTMARDLRIGSVSVVANRVSGPEDLDRIRQETGVEPLCSIPDTPSLQDYQGGVVEPVVEEAIAQLAAKLSAMAADGGT